MGKHPVHLGLPIKIFQKERFVREVLDQRGLSRQMAANPIIGDSRKKGIRITDVSRNSFFERIGLTEGDVIQRVVGESVSTTEELIQTLVGALQDGAKIIMIDRLRKDQRIDPIYIHLQ